MPAPAPMRRASAYRIASAAWSRSRLGVGSISIHPRFERLGEKSSRLGILDPNSSKAGRMTTDRSVIALGAAPVGLGV